MKTTKIPAMWRGCWNCLHSFIYGGIMIDRRRCKKDLRVIPLSDKTETCEEWGSSDAIHN